MGEVWTFGKVLNWTRDYLSAHGDEHPRLSAEWLLASVTGKSRVDLYLSFDAPLSADELHRMHGAIERRAAGEPLQYIGGETAFRHIVVRCERGVLVPRPETEGLVELAIEWLGEQGLEVPLALDVGCGTGCIALSIAREVGDATVVAVDVSPRAVALATRNRDALGLEGRVSVVESDLCQGLDEGLRGRVDLIVSNPPYVPSAVVEGLPREVRDFEPRLALDGGADGLDVFRRLLGEAPGWLRPGGLLAVELFEGHLDEARALVDAAGGWEPAEVRPDLTGRPRYLLAVRAGERP